MDIKGVWNFVRRPKFGGTDIVAATDSVDTLDNINLSGITLNQTVRWDGDDLVPIDWPTAAIWGNITGTLGNQTDLQNALDGKSDDGHAHTESDITDLGNYAVVGGAFHDGFSDYVAAEHVNWSVTGIEDVHADRIGETSVTQHEAAIQITESQITDLGNYSVVGHGHTEADISDLGNYAVIGGAHHDGFSDYVAAEHIDWSVTGAIGVHPDRIAAGAVTQHVASIDHDALLNHVSQEHIRWDLTGAEDIHVDRVGETAVTQHEGAIQVTESQITDLGNYSVVGHSHTESDITDLGNYAVVGHAHVEADITDLQDYALDSEVVHDTGDESIAGIKTFSNDVIVSGNLTVNGTTTQIHTQEVTIHDNIIILNYDETGVPSQNGGIEVERGTSNNASFIWNEASDKWTAGVLGSETEIVLAGGAYHDGFSDYVAAEHIDWSVTGAEDVHADRVSSGAVTQHVASIDHDSLLNAHNLTTDIDHDALTNFVTEEHIRWDLTGVEDIHQNRIEAGAVTQHVASIDHNSLFNAHDLTTDIDHDALTNFVTEEHIRWDLTGVEDVHVDRVAEGAVTQHEAAIEITESQISDFGTYEPAFAKNTGFNKNLGTSAGTVAEGDHQHTEADITDLGNYAVVGGAYHDGFSDYVAAEHVDWAVTGIEDVHADRITQGSVTQHQAALSITESQISDLQAYLTAEANDLTAAVVWANVPNANITEGSVTQHEGALSITESQISDLGNYAVIGGAHHDGFSDFVANEHIDWTVTGIEDVHADRVSQGSVTQHQAALSITESQISDLQAYLTAEANDLTAAVVWANVPNANITEGSVTQHQAALSITESQISDLGSYAVIGGAYHDGFSDYVAAEHIDWTVTGIEDVHADRITQGSVTQHQTALSITESQISDLGAYITGVAWGGVTGTLSNQTDLQLALDGKADDGHTHTEADITDLGNYALVGHAHAAADISSGTFADARIAETNVTQHEGALSITESQISDLSHFGGSANDLSDVSNTTPADRHVLVYDGVTDNRYENRLLVEADISDLGAYLTAEVNDLTGTVTWANVPNANITEGSVTQHQGALSITESQISDFGTYETAFTKNTAFNKDFGAVTGTVCEGDDSRLSDARTPTAHTHVEADITDLGNYAVIGGAYHDGFSDFVANEHVDHSAVSVNGTLSISGGGDLTADRNLALVNDSATPGNDKVYGTNGSGVKGWYDSGTASVGATTGRLNSWTADGDLFYQDFVHGLDTTQITYLLREYATNEEVGADKFDIIDTNTVRVYVDDAGEDLQINVVTGSGPAGPQGPAGDNTISLEEGGAAVTNTPHDTIDFDATDFNVSDNADGSATVTANFPADPDKTMRIGHTWAISGEVKVASGNTDFILPFFVSLASGQTAQVVKARYVLNGGTNCNVRIQKNGADLTGFTNMTVTTTATSTAPTAQSVTEDDKLALVVNSVSGTPTNLSFTLFLEYTN